MHSDVVVSEFDRKVERTVMTNNAPGEHLSEEPQSERGEPGSRDTGSNEPGGGPVDRPEGSLDHEETTSGSSAEDPKTPAEPTETEPVVPPYDERKGDADDSTID